MKFRPVMERLRQGWAPVLLGSGGAVALLSCASVSSSPPPAATVNVATSPAPALPPAGPGQPAPSPDPRVGLAGGYSDAASAIWNLALLSNTPPSSQLSDPTNPLDSRLKSSDLAFSGNIVFQGNYSGWQAWDVSNPLRPTVRTAYVCPGSQSDVSVYRNLLFVSHEATSGRVDCGIGGVPDPVSADRARGVRIYDISNLSNPRRITMVQTCRGSHTHTLATDPNDNANVYVYVSGSAGVRSGEELEGCSSGSMDQNPNTAQFRLEVIQVPLANPAAARIVSSPRVFNELTAPPSRGGGGGRAGGGGGGGRGGGRGGGPSQCHDITVYPAIGLAGGACGGYGMLLDIRDVRNPVRLQAVSDTNMSFWHSATFSNDGSKVLFSDEWGGGTAPRCRVTDQMEWGADAIFSINSNNSMTFRGYYKMPAPQTDFENCVAHNGSLIPVPGRDIMVQAWYQGGLSIIDWSDPANVVEIAYFDRGPIDPTRLVAAGYWSVYWYNGLIYGSEEFRGLDIFELKPSSWLTQNEIDAAKTVLVEQANPQMQEKIVWPPSFAKARAYLDQLARGNGIARERAVAIAAELRTAESRVGSGRRIVLETLATQLDSDVARASDAARVRLLIAAVRELVNAQ